MVSTISRSKLTRLKPAFVKPLFRTFLNFQIHKYTNPYNKQITFVEALFFLALFRTFLNIQKVLTLPRTYNTLCLIRPIAFKIEKTQPVKRVLASLSSSTLLYTLSGLFSQCATVLSDFFILGRYQFWCKLAKVETIVMRRNKICEILRLNP
jgi:hypothetical protein